jgi:hypothetical protein
MRRVTLFLSFCCFFGLLSQKTTAQVGINLGYQINQTDGWRAGESLNSVMDNGYKIGIDYWFRLKNKRIEFTPELSYAFYESTPSPNIFDFKVEFFSFQFNTNIYLLDLLNDCNCPTFSKQNDFFQKGFFVRIAPGVTVTRFTNNNEEGMRKNQFGNFEPMLGMGAGLDIGLSDLVTITPLFTANYILDAKWKGTQTLRINEGSTDLWQFTPTIRLGLRFDNY